jgi:hypothetical protein
MNTLYISLLSRKVITTVMFTFLRRLPRNWKRTDTSVRDFDNVGDVIDDDGDVNNNTSACMEEIVDYIDL